MSVAADEARHEQSTTGIDDFVSFIDEVFHRSNLINDMIENNKTII